MVTASQLREGMAVRIAGEVFKVLESSVKAGGGQLGGTVKAKLQNVISGRLWEHHFRPDERLEDLQLSRQVMEFLYSDGDMFYFMNPNTFEQIGIARGIVGERQRFLVEGSQMPVEFFEGNPISVLAPDTAELRVIDTAPASHGGQDSTWKEARLENGVQILVPLFIETGEMVRVDTRSARYLERARTEKKRGA